MRENPSRVNSNVNSENVISRASEELEMRLIAKEKFIDEQFQRECANAAHIFIDVSDEIKDSYNSLNKINSLSIRVSLKEAFVRVIYDSDETVWDEGMY